jgi:hypothetical protein
MQGKLGHLQRQLQAKQDALRKKTMRMLNPVEQSRPAFLVGCGRSGTSMLVWQLEKSWQVELYNEDHPAAFDNYRFRTLPEIQQLIAASEAPMTMFKPILDTVQTVRMLEFFPDSLVIFSFRHYTDVINSSLKKFGTYNRITHIRDWVTTDFAEFDIVAPPEETKEFVRSFWAEDLTPEEGAAIYWLFYNQLYYDLGMRDEPRVLLVCYESLVTRPEEQLREVAAFLGLTWEDRMSDGVYASSIGKNQPPVMRKQIVEACEEMYERLVGDAV